MHSHPSTGPTLRSLLVVATAIAGCGGDAATDAGADVGSTPNDVGTAADAGASETDAGDASTATDAGAARDAGEAVDGATSNDGGTTGGDAGVDPRADSCDLTGYPNLALEPIAPSHTWQMPVFVTQPPGSSDLYVVEREGQIIIVHADGATEAVPFLDISAQTGDFNPSAGGDERGLLGLAFHPDYQTNGRFYVAFTPTMGTRANVVAEGHRSAANPLVADATVTRIVDIRDTVGNNHNGGMISFGPDGYLYIGTGDGGGGGDPDRNGQDFGELLGKMLRIDVNGPAGAYTVPSDNPFLTRAGALPEIWALGLRNPWRFSFDRATGELFIADVGQDSWEEVDVQPAGMGGQNWGWRAFEGTAQYQNRGSELAADTTHSTPVLTVEHASDTALLRSACSISGGYVYRGSAIPALRGAYLFGDLCSDDIGAFRMCDGVLRDAQRLASLRGDAPSLVSFGQDNAGEVYVIYFNASGVAAEVARVVLGS